MSRPAIEAQLGRTPTFLRGWIVPAMLALGMVAPALAQHGGGGGHAFGGGHAGGFSGGGHTGGFSGGGGFRGGFSGTGSSFRGNAPSGATPFRGGSPYASRLGYGGAPRFGANAYGARGLERRFSPARPAFYNRGNGDYRLPHGVGNGYGYGYRGRGLRFGYGYGYPGFYSSNLFYNPFFFDPFFGFGDPFYDDGNAFWDSSSLNAPDANLGYSNGAPYDPGVQPQADPSSAYAQPYDNQASPAYTPDSEPGPWAPAGDGRQGYAPARQEDPVTIVFKDGRPAEHIRNYALTRTSLLVTDTRMREIPLDQIDLARTQQVNRAAGVDFTLPQSY